MKRAHRNLFTLVLLVGLWLVAPQVAYADNCSSLSDCYFTLRAALAAAVGLGVFAAFMAIGLDIGPLVGRLRSKFTGMSGPDPVPDEEAAWWDRSLGVLSLEGTMAGEVPDATRAARKAERKSEAVEAPEQAARQEQATEQMAQTGSPPEQASPEARTGDRGRDATQTAEMGREAGQVPSTSGDVGTAPDAGAVSEQAEDVARSFEDAADSVEQAGPDQAAKEISDLSSPEAPERMSRQARAEEVDIDTAQPSEQTQRESRTVDRGRGQGEPAEAGRSGAWEGDVESAGGQGADTGDVVDRARDVAQTFDSSQTEEVARSSQDVAGKPQASEQARHPSSQAQGAEATRQPMAQAEPASEQGQPPTEGMAQETPDAGHIRGKYNRQAEQIAGTFGQGVANEALNAMEALAHVGGSQRLRASLASASPAALLGLLAELGTVAMLTGQGASVEQVAHDLQGRRAADLLIEGGPVVEVKDYYWPSPYFQVGTNVADATRRLVRQAEWLRRRYPDRPLQFAFTDLPGAPQQVRFVLDRIGVDVGQAARAGDAQRSATVPQAYADVMSTMTAEQYWGGLSAAGWLDDIPSQRQAALLARVRTAFEHDARVAWLALADVVFDGESVYELKPEGESYQAHVTRFAEHSDGLFQPTNLANREEGGSLTVSFEHSGRRFEFDAAADTDYVDDGLIDLINRALAHSGARHRFVRLPAVDQMMYVALVSEESVRRAVNLNLIPPGTWAT